MHLKYDSTIGGIGKNLNKNPLLFFRPSNKSCTEFQHNIVHMIVYSHATFLFKTLYTYRNCTYLPHCLHYLVKSVQTYTAESFISRNTILTDAYVRRLFLHLAFHSQVQPIWQLSCLHPPEVQLYSVSLTMNFTSVYMSLHETNKTLDI